MATAEEVDAPGKRRPVPAELEQQVVRLLVRRAQRDALDLLQRRLSDPPCQQQVQSALVGACKCLPITWMGQEWVRLITQGEIPNPMSSRDGRVLRLICPTRRLSQSELTAAITRALHGRLEEESQVLLCSCWAQGRRPGKAHLSFMRAQAYLEAGHPDIAVKDAQTAMSYGPQQGGVSTWPWAWATRSAALEALADNTGAAGAMQSALELQPDNLFFRTALARLLNRIPAVQAQALQERGSKGLQEHLEEEAERAKPEFKRKRPRYYYYYKWMRERLHNHCGKLPAPVESKLLALDATELDMLLSHPLGIQRQAQQLIEIWNTKGAEYLQTCVVPHLSWQEAQALKTECPAAIKGDSVSEEAKAISQTAALKYDAFIAMPTDAEDDLDALE